MDKNSALKKLMKDFFVFGCFTFGGGMSIVAQMQQKFSDQEKIITAEELLDLTSVAKSLPGTMIANVAMLYGYRVAGLPGGLTAVFSMVLPPMALLIGVCFFYQAFRSNFWVTAVMNGMQAAVVPIILSAAVGMVRGSIKVPPCAAVAALCFCLYLFWQVNTLVLVLIGIAAGFAMGEYYERRGGLQNGAA